MILTLETSWVSIRTDALAGLFSAGLGVYLVYGQGGSSASQTGFSLTLAGMNSIRFVLPDDGSRRFSSWFQ